MKKKTALIFPGQGAQFPGMGKDFFDELPVAKAVFQEADDILGRHLSKLIFEGPADELTLTKNAQLAIYVTSIAMWRAAPASAEVCAGLSLGEYTALTAAGKVAFSDLLPVVALRGEAMHRASQNHPGTMAVVLGLADFDHLLPEGVWIANLNCPGQIVISGTKEGIARAAEILKAAGAKRVLPLDVSGAFHSGLMQDARDELTEVLTKLPIASGETELVMNVPGDYVVDAEAIRKHLIAQVTEPVYWEKGVRAMIAHGIESFIEIGPGKTLAGMNKKIAPDKETLTINTIKDLEHANS